MHPILPEFDRLHYLLQKNLWKLDTIQNLIQGREVELSELRKNEESIRSEILELEARLLVNPDIPDV